MKAKSEPELRFYLPHDNILSGGHLAHAFAPARRNDGSAGVDGVTFEAIERAGAEAWLAALREDLASMTYRPMPVRRVMIPKPGGGERPLGIPTVRDRVAQTAANWCWGDLRGGARGLCVRIQARTKRGRRDRGGSPVDPARLSRRRGRRLVEVFRHDPARRAHAKRGSADRRCESAAPPGQEPGVWLTSPVEERDGAGKRRMSGGKSTGKARRKAAASVRCPPTST